MVAHGCSGQRHGSVPADPGVRPEAREHYFVEDLTFADTDSITAMLRDPSPHLVDGYVPVWIRNVCDVGLASLGLLPVQRPRANLSRCGFS